MAYLTYEEYQTLANTTTSEEDFSKLERNAANVLDSLTRSFYQFNDLETDVPFRRNKFKAAMAAQIDYYSDMGSVTSYGLASTQGYSIGRTSFTGGATSSGVTNIGGATVPDSVILFLRDTNLLYRGVCSW